MKHQQRLRSTFGSSVSTSLNNSSKIAKKIVKKFKPSGAHLTGPMGAASEEQIVKKAQKRLIDNIDDSRDKVDAPTVKKYIRGVSLNDKFKGTWVAEGLTDEVTMGSLAKTVRQKDLIEEIIDADFKADQLLEEQKQSENLAHNYKEPPVQLGRYFNDFCNRNEQAFSYYKQKGIMEMAKSEVQRFNKKVKLQEEADRRGIKKEKMLDFVNKMSREEQIRKIVPRDLLKELQRREKFEQKRKNKTIDASSSMRTVTETQTSQNSLSFEDHHHQINLPNVGISRLESDVIENQEKFNDHKHDHMEFDIANSADSKRHSLILNLDDDETLAGQTTTDNNHLMNQSKERGAATDDQTTQDARSQSIKLPYAIKTSRNNNYYNNSNYHPINRKITNESKGLSHLTSLSPIVA